MPLRSRVGRRAVGRRDERRRVVLEPGQAPRAVHPEAAQESDLADGGADVGREPRAGGEHEQHVAGRRPEARRDEDDRADVGRRRTPPRRACATRAEPHRAAATGPYQRSHASRRPVDEPLADAGDAHFLARRRRRRDREQMTARAALDCAPRSCAARSTAGRHVDVQHRRHREHREQRQRRMNRHQQRDRDAEPQDPPARREQRHVHVIEHEDLVAQHRQAIEIVRTLVVRDRRDRRLQPRDVRFERDRHLVAEAALHARADDAQEPGRGRRHAEPERGARTSAAVAGRARRRRAASARARAARRAAPRAAPARTPTSISPGSCR